MKSGDFELLLVTMIWGINSIYVKDALSGFSPLQFNVVRLGLASALLLGLLAFSRGAKLPSRRDWGLVILSGFLGNTVYQLMFIKGIALSSASNTSFVLSTTPASTAVLSHLFGKQKMTKRMWSGVLLTMCGVAVMTLASHGATSLESATAGDLLTLVGTLGWSLYTVIAADLVKRMTPIEFTTWFMVSGWAMLVPFGLSELRNADWSSITTRNWLELVFSGALALVLSYIIWNQGVKRSGPARTGIYQNLTPVWTGLFAWLMLGESWSPGKFLGAFVVLAGVSLVRFAQPDRAKSVEGTR